MFKINTANANKKIIKLSAAVVVLIAVFFAVRQLLSLKDGDNVNSVDPAKAAEIANAENIKINKININLFSSQKFIDLEKYNVDFQRIEDIKKGNPSPFTAEAASQPPAVKIPDELFSQFSDEIGVQLTDEEKQSCIKKITDEKITSDKYSASVKDCFMEKRNSLLQ